jgi:DNA-binding GntR family transcriptional regulator
MQMTIVQALLVAVFRSARAGRRPNLTAFCKRSGVSVAELQAAFDRLESEGLVAFNPGGETLTLRGLAVGAALSRAASRHHRPLAACRPLAA